MTLNWRQDDYFESLLAQPEDAEAHKALELLVDDIHKDKEKTINAFIAHYGSEDFLWGIVRLLAEKNSRVAGNAAYIFGTLAEHDLGQVRVMSLINGSSPHTILTDLTDMLSYDDTECVMNAAGTMGTLAESKAGRVWMLTEPCLDDLLRKVTSLLSSANMWTASNAALVLARLSIAEEGCQRLLNHYSSLQIMTKLVESLGMDEAGRGMNAAFAIGRLCDIDDGRMRLLNHRDSEKMLDSLCCMLTSTDSGCGKNACYALSCLASSDQGHKRLLLHKNSDLMLHLLAQQLSNNDGETAWFAAMTLRTLAGKRQGVLRLRDHTDVVPLLKQISLKPSVNSDLLEEVDLTLELLKHLARPDAPGLEVKGPHEIEVTWPVVELKSGLPVTYSLYCEGKQVYEGPDTLQLVSGLRPFSKYSFSLRIHTEGDDSPYSDESMAKTQDAAPDAPEALRILGITTSQLRLGWAPPEYHNGGLKGYVIYNGKQQVETTTELSAIVSGLAPKTTYELYVCAYNHKGKGPKSYITATTEELGKHAPSKPTLTARGRSQIHVTWAPPDYPLGRIYRFELTTNGKVVYSGRELSFTVKQLTPNTEYTFTVIAVTSEGKCESDPVKKKTGKDEYNVQSTAPVFFSHPTKSTLETKPSNKPKERSHPRSPSRHSKKRDNHQLKARNSPGSIDTSMSRPISAASSSWSGNQKKRSTRVRSAKKQRESQPLNTDDARKNRHIAALKKLERGQKSSTGEESSEWSEEDRWQTHINQQVTGSNHTTINPSRQIEAKDDPEFLSVTVSYKDCSDDDALRGEGVGEKSASAESHELRRRHKVSRKDVTFDDKVHSERRDRRKQHPVGSHGEGLPGGEGILDHFPADSVDRRALMRLSMSMKRQQTLGMDQGEGLKYPGDVMSHMPHQRPSRHHQASTHDSNSKKRQLDSLANANRSSFNPSLAMQDLRLHENSNTSNDPSSRDNKDFTLMANGYVIYQEKPDSAEKKDSGKDLSSRRKSVQEDITDVEKLPDQLPEKSPREMGSLRGSWNDIDRFGVSDSENEDLDGRMVSRAASLVDDINNNNSNSSHRSNKSLSTVHKGAKRDVLSRNPLMDHALPSRSVLADHGSFYQRTNTFISSHRPTLKKNLARLVAPGPHNMPTQPTTQTTYDPEFPTNRKSSGGGANSYQFIPTQFRTQPVNLPTPLLPRGNTLASLQDRSAFVRKLEALSHMSSPQGAKSVSFCNDCGREPENKHVSLRYSHKHESHALHGPRLRSGHSDMISPPFAR